MEEQVRVRIKEETEVEVEVEVKEEHIFIKEAVATIFILLFSKELVRNCWHKEKAGDSGEINAAFFFSKGRRSVVVFLY